MFLGDNKGMNLNKIVKEIKKDCKANNVQLKLIPSQYTIIEEDKTSGYFDESNLNKLKIAVAIGNRPKTDWVPTLVHEYCHFLQLKNKNKAYLKNLNQNGKNSALIYNDYTVFKHKMPYRKAFESLKRVLLIELDCEKKVIRYLKKAKMSQEMIDLYAREANAYLFYLIFDFHYRNCNQKDLLLKKSSLIVDSMPDTLKAFDFYFRNYKKFMPFFETYFLKAKGKK